MNNHLLLSLVILLAGVAHGEPKTVRVDGLTPPTRLMIVATGAQVLARSLTTMDVVATDAMIEHWRSAGLKVSDLDLAKGDLPACYDNSTELATHLDGWLAQYPLLVNRSLIGISIENRDIHAYAFGNAPPTAPAVVFIAGLHARELAPNEIIRTLGDQLLAGYGVDPIATLLLDERRIFLVLNANPDGRLRVDDGEALWRKNANDGFCPQGNFGVDLNRNFPFGWGGTFSNPSTCDSTFRGPMANSEPETAALVAFIRGQFDDLRDGDEAAPRSTPGMVIDVHSYGELVLFPWGDRFVQSGLAPNVDDLAAIARKLTRFNDYAPIPSAQLYPTNGASDDFGYGDLGVPTFTLETGGFGDGQFRPNCTALSTKIVPDNVDALMEAALLADFAYERAQGPQVTFLSSAKVLAGDPVIPFSFLADDSVFDQRTSGAGESFANTPMPAITPIQGGSLRLAGDINMAASNLSVADGNADASVEWLTGSLDGTNLIPGTVTMAVASATDNQGNRGRETPILLQVLSPATAGRVDVLLVDDAEQPLALPIELDDGDDEIAGLGQVSWVGPAGSADFIVTAGSYASLPVQTHVSAGATSTLVLYLNDQCAAPLSLEPRLFCAGFE